MERLGFSPHLVPLAGKLDGINAVRITLKTAIIHPRCEVGISALEQYRRDWDDERKMFRANEVHDWTSHLADAFRYLSMAWRAMKPTEAPIKTPQLTGTVYLPGAPEPSRGNKKDWT
jgi:phage terminase large subunit